MPRWGAMSNEVPEPVNKRKRKSRWAAPDDQTFIPGMPTVMPSGLSDAQEKQYLYQLQIEEISRKLRSGDLGIPARPEDRSPSPEPIYNNEGKRMNTREYRTKKRLEEERHSLVISMQGVNPEFKPPADYKAPLIRVTDKVFIPQDDHPDINFIGLLIGPRGNTLRQLEKETGAKIIIRGKGSVKEGKIGRKDGQPMPGEDEPLHAYVTAQTNEHVAKAVKRINEIIKEGIEVPDGQSELRRQQMRDLALLNGTLRENDGLAKLRQMAEAQEIVTNTIICTICGGAGHPASDCKVRKPGDIFRASVGAGPPPAPTHMEKARMDSEYMSLMAELGEAPPEMAKAAPFSSRPQAPHATHAPQPLMSARPTFSQPPPLALMAPMNRVSAPPNFQPQNRPPWQQSTPTPPKPSGFSAPPPWQQQRPAQNSYTSPQPLMGISTTPTFNSAPPVSQQHVTGRSAPWLQQNSAPPPPSQPPPWLQQQTSNTLAPPPPPPAAMRPLLSAPPPPPPQ